MAPPLVFIYLFYIGVIFIFCAGVVFTVSTLGAGAGRVGATAEVTDGIGGMTERRRPPCIRAASLLFSVPALDS